MNKWTNLLILTLILCSFNSFSQIFVGKGISVKQSPDISNKEYNTMHFLPCTNGYKSLNKIDNEYYLVSYDNGLRQVGTPKRFGKIPKNATIFKVELFSGEILIAYKVMEKRARSGHISAVILSKEDLSEISKHEKLFEVGYWQLPKVIMSKDRQTLALIEYRDYKTYVYSMFEDFEFDEPYMLQQQDSTGTERSRFKVSNAGEVYRRCKVYNNEIDIKDAVFEDVVIQYSVDGDIKHVYKTNLKENDVYSSKWLINQNGDLCIIGLFSDSTYSAIDNFAQEVKTSGLYYVEFEKESNAKVKERFNRFEKGVLDIDIHGEIEYFKKSVYEQKDSKNRLLNLKEIEELSNGSIVVVTEQEWSKYKRYDGNTNGRVVVKVDLNLYDEIFFNLDTTGEITWTTKVEKAQYSNNESDYDAARKGTNIHNLTSYYIAKDVIHLFFIARGYGIPDLSLAEDAPNKAYLNSHLVYATISSDGRKSIQSLGMYDKKGVKPKLKSIKRYCAESCVFTLSSKKYKRIGMLNFH